MQCVRCIALDADNSKILGADANAKDSSGSLPKTNVHTAQLKATRHNNGPCRSRWCSCWTRPATPACRQVHPSPGQVGLCSCSSSVSLLKICAKFRYEIRNTQNIEPGKMSSRVSKALCWRFGTCVAAIFKGGRGFFWQNCKQLRFGNKI